MKSIPAMNKRGGKEYTQTTTGGPNTMGVGAKLSNRGKAEFPGAAPTRIAAGGGVDSKFYSGRGGKEYTAPMDNGNGYCKK